MKYLIKESHYVYLLENLDKNKRFLNNLMGIDFTGKLKQITSAYKVPYNFYRRGGITLNHAMSFIKTFGPMYLFELDGIEYLYLDKGNKDWFIDENGVTYTHDEIPRVLGIMDLGLRFSDIVDMYFKEGEPLNENVDKNKKFLTNHMGVDFTDKIKQVTSTYDVPMSFDEGVGSNLINRWLNHWGPMYLVNVNGKDYLYQNRGDFEMFIDEEGYDYVDGEILEQLGIDELGLRFSDIIDLYFNEEETLNEGIDMSQNLKVKKLLQNLIENKDFNISFEDEEYVYALGADYEELVYTPYEFKFHMIVRDVYGEGSNTIAKIDVIIDDIQRDNEDFYDEWVSDGYHEGVWYIEELNIKIDQEIFEDLPISIYLTFYGYDE